jgi:hypothetical protein
VVQAFKTAIPQDTCPKAQTEVQWKQEVEFVTIMWFDSLDAVRAFAGDDYEVAVVPEKARAVLSHFDERSQHYEVRAERSGQE